MKTCSIEGCDAKIWSKGLCLNHLKRKPLPASRQLGVRAKVQSFVDRERINKMRSFFMEIWKKRKHYSEVSGVFLGDEPMSTYFHHIMPKEKYPELAYEESNIILLTFPEHSNVENDMYKYNIINEKRKELMKKYDLC
jgi:hypothetical protein